MTTEQTLLLNNLMYLQNNAPFHSVEHFANHSIADWINSIDVSQIKDSTAYGQYMTGEDWKDIINAVKQDDTLMSMTIQATHRDTSTGGNGLSAVFTSDSTQEALVVFKGTEGAAEWTDNFQGGNQSDTIMQQSALDWYQEVYQEYGLENYKITVSGHSKGGNKAKYIAILDDTIDHCVSFDGQGFSDKFMEKYADDIAARQNVIENHNVDYDYVNILLNDVGDTTYYHGYDYGEGGFLENHCPNTFMNFNGDGSFSMHVNPDGQAPEMKALDEFLNNLIRSMPEDQRGDALELVNEIVQNALSGKKDVSFWVDLITDPEYSDDLAYILAYAIKYEQENPEVAEQIKQVLKEFGMEDAVEWVDIVDGLLNAEFDFGKLGTFDISSLLGIFGSLSNIPDWVLNIIRKGLNIFGIEIELTNEQLRNLLRICGMVKDDLEDIKIKDNGEDIHIESVTGTGADGFGSSQIHVILPTLKNASSDIHNVASSLNQISATVESEANNISFSLSGSSNIRIRLLTAGNLLNRLSDMTEQMSEALTNAAVAYENAENTIIKSCSSLV